LIGSQIGPQLPADEQQSEETVPQGSVHPPQGTQLPAKPAGIIANVAINVSARRPNQTTGVTSLKQLQKSKINDPRADFIVVDHRHAMIGYKNSLPPNWTNFQVGTEWLRNRPHNRFNRYDRNSRNNTARVNAAPQILVCGGRGIGFACLAGY
jgi:hypothetical protein